MDHDTSDACFIVDDDGAPQGKDTEAEAVELAKDYASSSTMVLKTVARVSRSTRIKVEKIK
jgi:hypothetical protein